MIYFQTADKRYVLILEPSQVSQLTKGIPAVSDDHKVLVAYSPDIEWTFGEIKRIMGPNGGKVLLATELDQLLKEGMRRSTVTRPPTPRVRRIATNPTLKGKKP